MSSRPFEILLVEDDSAGPRVATEALGDGKILNHVNLVNDSVDALAYLRREGRYARVARPDIVLVHLNLPGLDARELLLGAVKNDVSLKQIPMVVITNSHLEEERVRSYGLPANCYVTTPVDFDQWRPKQPRANLN